jgi:hypothetical protein
VHQQLKQNQKDDETNRLVMKPRLVSWSPLPAFQSRMALCDVFGLAKPAVLNPKPGSPYKALTYLATHHSWDVSCELYGHVAQIEVQTGDPHDTMMDSLQSWLRANKSYFAVYVSNKVGIGAVAFPLPLRMPYTPKPYLPKTG